MTGSRVRNASGRLAALVERHPLAVFLIWAVVCSYEFWIFGNLSYVRLDDNADATLAMKLGLARDLMQYGFTWWCDLAVSGADNIALATVSEIDTLPFLVLPGWLAYGGVLFVQRFIAGYFMYRLMRESLGLRLIPALFAAMAYALFAQNWLLDSWNGNTLYHGLALPSLPLMLWALEKLSAMPGWRQRIYAALMGAWIAISGYFVFIFFIIPFLLYWLLVIKRISWRKLLVPVVLFTGFWVLFELPAQIPAALNAGLSHRANWSFSDQPWDTALMYLGRMAKDNYLALAVTALAVSMGFLRYKRLGWLALSLAGIAVLMCAKPWIAAFTEAHMGFIRGVQFDRVYFSLPFIVIAMGAIGLDALFAWRERHAEGNAIARALRQSRAGTVLPIVVTGALVLLSTYSFVQNERKMVQQMTTGMNYAAMFENPGIGALKRDAEGKGLFRAATVTTWNNRLDAIDTRKGMNPLNTGNLWAQGIQTADGYVLLFPQRYRLLWGEVIAPRYPKRGPDHSQFNTWGGKAYLFFPPDSIRKHAQEFKFEAYYNLNLLSLLNVRYIVSNFRHPDSTLREVWNGDGELQRWEEMAGGMSQLKQHLSGKPLHYPIAVYENPEVLPRYFAVTAARRYETGEAALDALGRATMDEIRNFVFVANEDYPAGAADGWSGKGTVRLLSYTPDRYRVRVQSDAGCIFVASSAYSPYWTATIDGAKTEVFPAYYALQGVVVPAGKHTVEMRYEPPYACR